MRTLLSAQLLGCCKFLSHDKPSLIHWYREVGPGHVLEITDGDGIAFDEQAYARAGKLSVDANFVATRRDRAIDCGCAEHKVPPVNWFSEAMRAPRAGRVMGGKGRT
jgi:hypothetical protein